MNSTRLTLTALSCIFIFSMCKREYDLPPLEPLKEGASVFIASLKARVSGSVKHYRFSYGDSSLFCTVTADESSGNLFKQIYVRDDAGDAIQVNLLSAGGIFTGDRIRINMNGLYVINANSMIYIDSVDLVKNAVKLSSGNIINPKDVTLPDLLVQSPAGKPSALQAQLIRVKGIEFLPNPNYSSFADAVSKISVEHNLKDCQNFQLTVRSSGYANFASTPLPTGNGSIVGVISQYNDRLQLSIRNYKDVNMTGPLCSITNPTTNPSVLYLKKDFNDNTISSGGWSTYTVSNSLVNWSVSSFSTTPTPFAKISGFVNGNNSLSETWLISPAIDLSNTSNPYLSFGTAAKYPGDLLEVLVSTNYSSGTPSTANWESLAGSYTLSPAPQTGGYVWTPSGKVNLNNYKTTATHIAFKYSSTPLGSTTYELDDIVVQQD